MRVLSSSSFHALFAPLRKPLTQRQSVGLVFLCTLLGAAAQVLMKIGANRLPSFSGATLGSVLAAVALNLPLILGLSCYGLFTVGLIFALRDGELSILYPVIALNYVWVTILSVLLFRESINVFKLIGISTIVFGVIVLGRSSRTREP